jgi:hypothetical protein
VCLQQARRQEWPGAARVIESVGAAGHLEFVPSKGAEELTESNGTEADQRVDLLLLGAVRWHSDGERAPELDDAVLR